MNRAALFQAIRAFAPEGRFTADHVKTIDGLADSFGLGGLATDATPAYRQINARGLQLIKDFEGLRLTSYPDPATGGAPWTVGWGHTGPDVSPGMTITESKAAQLLFKDLKRFEVAVAKLAPVATDNQFSAMVSLAFNVGEGNLSSSTLLKMHNAGDYAGAQAQYARWNRAAGKVMAGLTRRRTAEAMLYGHSG